MSDDQHSRTYVNTIPSHPLHSVYFGLGILYNDEWHTDKNLSVETGRKKKSKQNYAIFCLGPNALKQFSQWHESPPLNVLNLQAESTADGADLFLCRRV